MDTALVQRIHGLDADRRNFVLERFSERLNNGLARGADIAHRFHGPLANEKVVIFEGSQKRRHRVLRIFAETTEYARGFGALVGIGVFQDGNPLRDGFAHENRRFLRRLGSP